MVATQLHYPAYHKLFMPMSAWAFDDWMVEGCLLSIRVLFCHCHSLQFHHPRLIESLRKAFRLETWVHRDSFRMEGSFVGSRTNRKESSVSPEFWAAQVARSLSSNACNAGSHNCLKFNQNIFVGQSCLVDDRMNWPVPWPFPASCGQA